MGKYEKKGGMWPKYTIRCLGCGKEYDTGSACKGAAARLAEGQGYGVVKGRWYCQSCFSPHAKEAQCS